MPVMTITIIAIILLLLFTGSSFTVALGLSSILVLLIFNPLPNLLIIPQLFAESSASFILLAVPLFILAGYLMAKGSVGANLIDFANAVVGSMRGGLGNANIVGSMIFGGISGSSLADTAIFSTILIPKMEQDNYPRVYAAAVTLASSSLAVIIPPSILMVMAAAVTRLSVARALLAGLTPGILITTAMVIMNILICKKHNYGTKHKFSFRNIWDSFKKTWTALLAPLIILGSIFTGIVTPTEAAAVTVVYILFIDFVIFKRLTIKDILLSIKESAKSTGTLLIIASASAVVTYVIAIENIPAMVGQFLVNMPGGDIVFYILLDIILLLIGMFLDTSPSIMIFCPLLLPIAISIGMDPVHFLATCVFGLALGLTTPPYGVCLFSVCNITRIPIDKVIKATIPYYVLMFLVLFLVTIFPQLSVGLCNLVGI